MSTRVDGTTRLTHGRCREWRQGSRNNRQYNRFSHKVANRTARIWVPRTPNRESSRNSRQRSHRKQIPREYRSSNRSNLSRMRRRLILCPFEVAIGLFKNIIDCEEINIEDYEKQNINMVRVQGALREKRRRRNAQKGY